MNGSAGMMVFTLYKLQLASHTDIIRSLKGFAPTEFVASFDKGKERLVKAMESFPRLGDYDEISLLTQAYLLGLLCDYVLFPCCY